MATALAASKYLTLSLPLWLPPPFDYEASNTTDYPLTAPFLDPKTSARSQIPTAIYDRLDKPPQKPYKTKKLTQIRPGRLP